MSTGTHETTELAWSRVREAISQRWPHISRDELRQCDDNVQALADLVKRRVEASDTEVEAVVREFAPPLPKSQQSATQRLAHGATHQVEQASQAVRSAYERMDECIAERPTESVLTSFVAGIVLGATVTALWFSAQRQPEPSMWDRVKPRSWS